MREIKFRAWDNVSKVMKHWDDYGPPTQLLEVYLYDTEDEIGFKNDGYIMQYTGRKDRNGIEIYEGDIVRWVDEYAYLNEEAEYETVTKIGSVVYRDRGFWISSEDYMENFGWEGEDLWDWDEIEVIGNVYENKELLKEEAHEKS